MQKVNLGPLLDAAVAAEEAYDTLMEKLAKAPDDKKEQKAREAALKAISPAKNAAGMYMNALRGIERARPDQASSARKLGSALMNMSNALEHMNHRLGGCSISL
jgi:hypothetical protein